MTSLTTIVNRRLLQTCLPITSGRNLCRALSTNDSAGKWPVSSHRVEVNGVNYHYSKSGTGDTPLLLLSGVLGCGKTDFAQQLGHLNGDKLTVYALDLRGCGLSIPPERNWENFYEKDADDAAAVMKKLNIDHYTVAGWSDGGNSGMIMAGKYTQNVSKLIIWGSNSHVTKEDLNLYEAIRDLNKWSDRMRKPFVDFYGVEYFKKHWNLWIDMISVYIKEKDGNICRHLLHHIKCPTLIMQGTKDPMLPNFHAEYNHKHISNSRLELFEGGKHNIHMKYYKEFNDMLENFVMQSKFV